MPETIPVERVRAAGLRRLNLIAAALHAASAAAMLALGGGLSLPIGARYMDGPPGGPEPRVAETLVDVRIAWVTAAFLALSAIAHLVISAPGVHERYLARLAAGRAPFRWAEYAVSSSVMLVPIALLAGVDDAAAIVGIVGANASMILFGQLMELHEADRRADVPRRWSPFWFGCIAGAVPWIAIGIYLLGPGTAPGFVYAIFISLFLFFNCFALVMLAHYRGWGRFGDYLVGERTYIVLSLTAKTALAWQVYAGALAS